MPRSAQCPFTPVCSSVSLSFPLGRPHRSLPPIKCTISLNGHSSRPSHPSMRKHLHHPFTRMSAHSHCRPSIVRFSRSLSLSCTSHCPIPSLSKQCDQILTAVHTEILSVCTYTHTHGQYICKISTFLYCVKEPLFYSQVSSLPRSLSTHIL